MSGYIGQIPTPQATQTRQSFTATASQTTFATIGYTPGFLDVFLNGVHLLNGTDYTATNGSDVVLTTGAAASDVLEVISYSTFEVNDQSFTGTTTAEDLTVTGAFTSQGIDDNASSTAMTLDASGNLLVGTTDNNVADNSGTSNSGFNVRSSGRVLIAEPENAGLWVNRLGNDGDIAVFRKDGTTVGSIGANSGDLYIGEGDTGLKFDAEFDAIVPFNTSTLANRDGAVDLGYSNPRFKDLYLSGGVYLGGTGADNKLDDVEYGTFNPTIAGSTSTGAPSVYGKRVGRYVKVGHLVHVQITLGWSSHTGTGNMSVRDLPFTAVSGGITGQSVLSIGYNSGLSRSTGRVIGIYVGNGTTIGAFTETAENGDIQGLSIDANVNEIIIAGTYYAQ